MEIALWVIALCEVVRLAQNALQLVMIKHDRKGRDNAYSEFVKSLKETDKEFVQKMLLEFEKNHEED